MTNDEDVMFYENVHVFKKYQQSESGQKRLYRVKLYQIWRKNKLPSGCLQPILYQFCSSFKICRTLVIHLSYTCQTHIIHHFMHMSYTTSYTCLTLLLTSVTCNTPVRHLSNNHITPVTSHHTPVKHLSHNCFTLVTHLSHILHTYYTHVSKMLHTCHTPGTEPLTYLSQTCHKSVKHMWG